MPINNNFNSTILCIALTCIISVITAGTTTTSGTAAEQPCKPYAGMWGDPDPNIFYICNEQTNTAIALKCPAGRGFFDGFGYYGCIPFADWPACTSADALTQICDSEHLLQPWQTVDPNKFYMCPDEAQAPMLVNCEQGKGFVSAQHDTGSIVGCAKWHMWRHYMQCTDYY